MAVCILDTLRITPEPCLMRSAAQQRGRNQLFKAAPPSKKIILAYAELLGLELCKAVAHLDGLMLAEMGAEVGCSW